MFCVENSQRIAKYVLLSLLCFDSVFSAAFETTQKLESDDEVVYDVYEDESIDAKDGDILHFDFFRFTTRKRYIWEDWDITVPTRDYEKYTETQTDTFFLYLLLAVGVIALLVLSVVALCKNECSCSEDSDSSSSSFSSRFTTVHPPPQRTTGVSQANSNVLTAHAPGATVAYVNFTYTSTTQDGRLPDHTVAERPPDYSVVTLNDLVNPTQPAFPVVKPDNETPPPEYGKRNPF